MIAVVTPAGDMQEQIQLRRSVFDNGLAAASHSHSVAGFPQSPAVFVLAFILSRPVRLFQFFWNGCCVIWIGRKRKRALPLVNALGLRPSFQQYIAQVIIDRGIVGSASKAFFRDTARLPCTAREHRATSPYCRRFAGR